MPEDLWAQNERIANDILQKRLRGFRLRRVLSEVLAQESPWAGGGPEAKTSGFAKSERRSYAVEGNACAPDPAKRPGPLQAKKVH